MPRLFEEPVTVTSQYPTSNRFLSATRVHWLGKTMIQNNDPRTIALMQKKRRDAHCPTMIVGSLIDSRPWQQRRLNGYLQAYRETSPQNATQFRSEASGKVVADENHKLPTFTKM